MAHAAPFPKPLPQLFPNTYEFTRMQTMQEMAAAMVKQFRQVAREIGLTDVHIADVKNTAVQSNDEKTNRALSTDKIQTHLQTYST